MDSLTQEQVNDLYSTFSSLRKRNELEWADLKTAMEIVGVPIAGHELRDIIGTPRRCIEINEFNQLYIRAKEMKDTAKLIRQSSVLKHDEDVEAFTLGEVDSGTRHSVCKAEERGLTQWINQRLSYDPDLKDILPIDPSVDGQLYQKCKNGVLLCKLVNAASPDTIDERSINRGAALKHVFNVHENLSLAINSAAAIGCCVVNTGPDDIMQGKRHILLGLIWQLIRRGLVDTITLNKHSELLGLLNDDERMEDLMELKPEEILMRWVNYHLLRAGCDRRITNFNSDLADSVVYAHLVEQIAPFEKKHAVMTAGEMLNSMSRQERAANVLNNAEALGAPCIMRAEDIYLAGDKDKENRDRLNLAFLATLFNLHPALDNAVTNGREFGIDGESFEERTYRNFMNSFGVKPYVTFLFTDLCNGLVFLQLLEKIRPGIVEWSRVVQHFDPKRQLFQEQANCNMVVEAARRLKIPLVNISGEDIRNRNRTLILGVCFQLMQAYSYKLLYDANGGTMPNDDKEILRWVNEQLSACNAKPLCSFRDPVLTTGVPVLQLLEHIKPNSTQKAIWQAGDSDDFSICQYAISCCRKAGARIFALPEHLRDLNAKMIMTLFVCLQALSLTLKEKAASKQRRSSSALGRWFKLNGENGA